MSAIHAARSPKPPAVHGFEHIQRYWEPTAQRWTAKILPGEYYVTHNAEAITTVLGSCVSACIRDSACGCGGMNHFMLAEDRGDGGGSWNEADGGASTRFGCYAMERLINELLKLGARRERLEVKLFGGGQILPGMTDVGDRNVSFAQSFLRTERLALVAQDVGDVYPRRIIFLPATGQVLLKYLRAIDEGAVADDEARYRSDLANGTGAGSGSIELFN